MPVQRFVRSRSGGGGELDLGALVSGIFGPGIEDKYAAKAESRAEERRRAALLEAQKQRDLDTLTLGESIQKLTPEGSPLKKVDPHTIGTYFTKMTAPQAPFDPLAIPQNTAVADQLNRLLYEGSSETDIVQNIGGIPYKVGTKRTPVSVRGAGSPTNDDISAILGSSGLNLGGTSNNISPNIVADQDGYLLTNSPPGLSSLKPRTVNALNLGKSVIPLSSYEKSARTAQKLTDVTKVAKQTANIKTELAQLYNQYKNVKGGKTIQASPSYGMPGGIISPEQQIAEILDNIKTRLKLHKELTGQDFVFPAE